MNSIKYGPNTRPMSENEVACAADDPSYVAYLRDQKRIRDLDASEQNVLAKSREIAKSEREAYRNWLQGQPEYKIGLFLKTFDHAAGIKVEFGHGSSYIIGILRFICGKNGNERFTVYGEHAIASFGADEVREVKFRYHECGTQYLTIAL